ncbi:hypothetical protein KAU39_01265 [bacterium]|nr:hypothetical protein [bacterium]
MKNYLKISIFISLFFHLNISFLGANERNKSIMKEIIELTQKSQAVEKDIIKRMRFNLIKKQIVLDGSTEKYLLRDNNDIDLWLFKSYPYPRQVKISNSVYFLAELIGISTPLIDEIALPVNGRMTYGSIQKFISGAKRIKDMELTELSDRQIAEIQRCQIFNWLIFNNDSGEKHLIVHPKTKKIIIIDNDNALDFRIKKRLSLNKYLLSEFNGFWNDYIESKIILDFKEGLDFIDYIENIDNDKLKEILSLVIDNQERINEFFLRRKNLKTDFKKFYCEIEKLRDKMFNESIRGNGEEYAMLLLKKVKISLSEKKQLLDELKSKRLIKQKDIKVVSSKEAWRMARKISYSSNKEFSTCLKKVFEKLKCLENSNLNICEKLAVNLYKEEIEKECMENSLENFVKEGGIKRITIHPSMMTAKKILNIEYNLMSMYGRRRKALAHYKKELTKDNGSVLSHLNYIKYPIQRRKERNEILKEYQQKIKKGENKQVNKFICKMVQKDKKDLGEIDDSFVWKYLGLALVNVLDECKKKAIESCNKSLVLTNDTLVIYWSYLLLGFLYEHNDCWERFGEGFEIDKSIAAYKNAFIIDPKAVEACLNLGILYLIKEEPDNAFDQFKKVDKFDPEYGRKHFHFDKIKRKELYEDRKAYLKAVKMNTLSGRHHYILGMAYLVKNDKELAEQHFSKAREFGFKVNVKSEQN